MSSKKNVKSEGIALLSIYGDEDDDTEEAIDNTVPTENKEQSEVGANETANTEEDDSKAHNNINGMSYIYGCSTDPVINLDSDNENTTPETVQPLTPSRQQTPQSSLHIDQSDTERKKMDPLDKFLPPPPTSKCSDKLQEKIIKFISLKKITGRSYNSEARNRKEYRNPDFLLNVATYHNIDQIGSWLRKDVFSPHGYNKSDFYDEIALLAGAGGRSDPVSDAVDTRIQEGRPNKKSRWDKKE